MRANLCNTPCALWCIMPESTRGLTMTRAAHFIRPSLRDLDATTTRSFYHKVVQMGLGGGTQNSRVLKKVDSATKSIQFVQYYLLERTRRARMPIDFERMSIDASPDN